MHKILIAVCFVVGISACVTTPMYTSTIQEYDRNEWGRWIDEDKDCQDTRQEVLIKYSKIPVTFKTDKHCKVLTGKWICPYTGKVFTDPSLLDIDHIVPLKEVYESGGSYWPEEQKKKYFNDQFGLIPVDRSANRSKGSRQPHEWLPSNQEVICQYVTQWMLVKGRWGMTTDNVEANLLVHNFGVHCPHIDMLGRLFD